MKISVLHDFYSITHTILANQEVMNNITYNEEYLMFTDRWRAKNI